MEKKNSTDKWNVLIMILCLANLIAMSIPGSYILRFYEGFDPSRSYWNGTIETLFACLLGIAALVDAAIMVMFDCEYHLAMITMNVFMVFTELSSSVFFYAYAHPGVDVLPYVPPVLSVLVVGISLIRLYRE